MSSIYLLMAALMVVMETCCLYVSQLAKETLNYCFVLLLAGIIGHACPQKLSVTMVEIIAAHRFMCLSWHTQSASQSAAELHCLRDNAWLTWSTSEPDILLSLHHNTTTQTDMAGPLISRAGLTDLLCAHCNGFTISLRIHWRWTQIYRSVCRCAGVLLQMLE